MLYRSYKPEDFDALYAIEERCFEPPFRFDRAYMRQLVGNKNAATWVAEEDGRMQGFAIVHWAQRKQVLAAYIETIEVLPEARGQGAGSQLLRRIESSAQLAGATQIGLHVEVANAAAIRLYEARGYLRVGRKENYYPLGRAAFLYRKRLNSSAD